MTRQARYRTVLAIIAALVILAALAAVVSPLP